MKYHTTQNGVKIKLKDLEDSHLNNILRWMEAKANKGLKVSYGGGTCADDMWYDEEVLYGEKALKEMDYYEYKKELNRRHGNKR